MRNKKLSVYGFVPVRLNSKRVPGKNIKMLYNRPLIQYNLETLLNCGLDEVYVFCSSPDIKDYLPDGVTLLLRNACLDADTTMGIEIWRDFSEKVKCDVIVQSHATAPFISSDSIRTGLKAVVEDGYGSASSVNQIKTYCWYEGKPVNYSKTNIIQTQRLSPVLVETGGFYIWRFDVLEKYNSRISPNHFFHPVSKIEGIDIDYQDDFRLAEAVAKGLYEKKDNQMQIS